MPNHTGVSPESPNKYLGPNVYLTLCVTRNREPTGADYRQPETGKLYPFNSFWLVGKDPTTGVQGDMWYLSKIVANVAYWVKLSTGTSGPLLQVAVDANTPPGTDPVDPDGDGLLTITGGQVASGVIGANVIRTHSVALNQFTIEIQRSETSATPNSALNGVSHYNALKFTVDTDGYVDLVENPKPGATNLGITYNSGTGVFTVCAANGSALSATNPAYVTVASKTSKGLFVTIPVTANQTFIDSNGSSTIIGNLFGMTTGVATTNNQPFFLYAVSNDAQDTISFMISRYPNNNFTPASTKIGTPSSAIADTQGSFFAFTNITTTDYDLNPCISIGSFRMTFIAADNWTVSTLNEFDGIGHFQNAVQFAANRGQLGAATGKLFKNNGGSAPDDADGVMGYYVDALQNRVFFTLSFPQIDTAGATGVSAVLALPYVRQEGANLGGGATGNGATYQVFVLGSAPSTNSAVFTATAPLLNTDFPLNNDVTLNGAFNIAFV